jgi:hypothetical protein
VKFKFEFDTIRIRYYIKKNQVKFFNLKKVSQNSLVFSVSKDIWNVVVKFKFEFDTIGFDTILKKIK